jgi:AbrB family looped-hinge helix DNA binding protein
MEIETKVGPKGQVLIPKSFREWYNLLPGDSVLLIESDNEIILRKAIEDPIGILENLAKKYGKNIKIENYAEEIEERWKRAKK